MKCSKLLQFILERALHVIDIIIAHKLLTLM